MRSSLLVIGVCLLLFVPGLTRIPPVDRDEPRYAAAAREMLETHNYIDIKFQNARRNQKPVGVYWLEALSVSLAGRSQADEIWPYRIPSLVAAIAAVLLTFTVGRLLFDTTTALLGALLLAASPLLGVEARLATTDAVLLVTVLLAQLALAHAYRAAAGSGARWRWTMVTFWSAIGVGILVKGPITAMVVGLTVIALWWADRGAAWVPQLNPRVGVLLAAAIPLPWLGAIGAATDGAFFRDSIGADLLPKLISVQEGHAGLPGYHAVLLPLLFWPGSLFALLAVPWVWRHRRQPGVRFCLAWLVPTWLVFELTRTKLPHYVLPVYPAIAILSAAALRDRAATAATGWNRTVLVLWSAVGVVLAGSIVALPLGLERRPEVSAVVAALAVMVVTAGGWRLLKIGPRPGPVLAMAVGTLGACLATYQFVVPGLHSVWLSREVAAAVHAHAGGRARPVASAGFAEPSLVFLLGTGTILTDGRGAADHLIDDPDTLAIVAGSARRDFQARLGDAGVRPRELALVQGINYSTGNRLELALYGR